MGCSGSSGHDVGKPRAGAQSSAPAKRNVKKVLTDIPEDATQPTYSSGKFLDIYDIEEQIGVIGRGAFSIVRAARHKQTGLRVAVKCVDKSALSEDQEAHLKQEAAILQSLDHPSVLKCLGFYDNGPYYYLVMEYLAGGELFDRIVKKSYYNENDARWIVKIILNAFAYIHSQGVVHRDMKPENLILLSTDNDKIIKVADFGFAVKTTGHSNLRARLGSLGYEAPEVLLDEPYGKPVDMWDIGVIMYILLGGYPPFADEHIPTLFAKIKKAEFEFHEQYWKDVSEDAKDLIRKLLRKKPLARLTAEEALQHPWVCIGHTYIVHSSLYYTYYSLIVSNIHI
jgi:serine/threonine protein kinase